MADRIVNCVVRKEDNVIKEYFISYLLEKTVNPLKTRNCSVQVRAEEMTDPTDEAEAKAKANVKAAEVKAIFDAEPEVVVTTEQVVSVVGDVVLGE